MIDIDGSTTQKPFSNFNFRDWSSDQVSMNLVSSESSHRDESNGGKIISFMINIGGVMAQQNI